VTDYIAKKQAWMAHRRAGKSESNWLIDRAYQLMTALGLSIDEAIAEAKEELRAVYETPLRDALEAARERGYTAADSVRPERLWGMMHVPAEFTVGRKYGLDPATGEWRAFTDEEQARGWMTPPTGTVTVTRVDTEAGTFTAQLYPEQVAALEEAPRQLWRIGGRP
jgi:hypothetical protein